MFVGSQKRHFSSQHVNLSCVFTVSNIDVGIVSITSDRGLKICVHMFRESRRMVHLFIK